MTDESDSPTPPSTPQPAGSNPASRAPSSPRAPAAPQPPRTPAAATPPRAASAPRPSVAPMAVPELLDDDTPSVVEVIVDAVAAAVVIAFTVLIAKEILPFL